MKYFGKMINTNYKVFISPPFARYIYFNKSIPILGSYTLEPRFGAFMQFLKTFRTYKGGYINKIGLRNPGINSLKKFNADYFTNKVVSIAVIKREEWLGLAQKLSSLNINNFSPLMVEINISCPNVNYKYEDLSSILNIITKNAPNLTYGVKLSATIENLDIIKTCLDYGITTIHLSNTLPSEKGGISGPLLREKSLHIISEVKSEFREDVSIIGGGGIYSKLDIDNYKKAGATYFSLSTVLVKHPLRVKQIINYASSF